MTSELPRVVILGASNVSRSLGTIVNLARRQTAGRTEFLLAAGHGRSYGAWSSVLGRGLPAIRSCGLWKALAERSASSTQALVTDIGNDLLYGFSPEQIAAWVGECTDRLRAAEARIVLTELPLANLERLSAARFRFFRALFFPRCRLDLPEVSARARRLNELLRGVAADQGLSTTAPRSEWYGFDPIHVRYAHARAAWSETLAGWSGDALGVAPQRGSLREALYLRALAPAERRFGRITRHCAQPVGTLADGSRIACY